MTTRCPSCSMPLTQRERERAACPCCGSVLPLQKVQLDLKRLVARQRDRTAQWLWFGGLLGVSCAAFAAAPWLLDGGAEAAHYAFLAAVVVPLLAALVPLHQILNRPMMHLPWYRRPENILRLGSATVMAGCYLLAALKLVPAGAPLFAPVVVSFAVLAVTLRCVRLR
ncbi:MAG: hypothetical protein RIC55_24060 [Pirellulaceae bacterium]